MVQCKICYRELKSLKGLARHLYHKHKSISSKQYYDRFIKTDDEGECLTCGNNTKFSGLGYGYLDHCSKSCAQRDLNLIKKRNFKRKLKLGIDPNRSPKIKKCQCGCGQNVIQSDTSYCQGHSNRSIKVKQKKIKTYQENMGVDNPFQSKKIQDQIKTTCMLRYGVENPFQCDLIKSKYEQTCLNRYGVSWPMQLEQTKQKLKYTCLSRYGVDNFAKTKQGREICRKNFIRMIENEKLNGETLYGRVGDFERLCLNELQIHTKFKILRNIQLIGYIPDGYIVETKLIIEFDERHHFVDFYQTYCDKDIQKNQNYKDAGFKIFRIKKNEWENDPDQIIKVFKHLQS